jgi:hypothetical protein
MTVPTATRARMYHRRPLTLAIVSSLDKSLLG